MLRAAILAALLLLPASAHGRQSVSSYPVERLSRVMGELHAIRFVCEGPGAQVWRERMAELLELEAPVRGPYRERLIAEFNGGFADRQRARPRLSCGAETQRIERRLAEEGEQLADRLRRTYIE